MKKKSALLALVLFVFIFGVAGNVRAISLGDSLLISRLFPQDYSWYSSTVVVGAGVEYSDYVLTIDISPDDPQILFDFFVLGMAYGAGDFNGFGMFDVNGTIPSFSGLTINSTNISGMNASKLSFTSDNLFVDFSGLTVTSNSYLALNVESSNPVPEPSTMVLLGSGLLGLVGLNRRRKK